MRGASGLMAAIAGVALSAMIGLFVAASLNTYLADYWIRGFASCAFGIAVAVQLARSVLARHAPWLPGRHRREE